VVQETFRYSDKFVKFLHHHQDHQDEFIMKLVGFYSIFCCWLGITFNCSVNNPL